MSQAVVTVSRPVGGGVARRLSTGGSDGRLCPLTCGFTPFAGGGTHRWKLPFRSLSRPFAAWERITGRAWSGFPEG